MFSIFRVVLMLLLPLLLACGGDEAPAGSAGNAAADAQADASVDADASLDTEAVGATEAGADTAIGDAGAEATAPDVDAGTTDAAADGGADSTDQDASPAEVGPDSALDSNAADSDSTTDPDSSDAIDADTADSSPAVDTADTAVALPQCATADDCPTQNPCLLGTCTAKGTCAYVPKADNSPCDDGNACTTADACTAGQCLGKGQLACDDENPCTADKCNPIAGCLNLPVAASSACDDGDACTQGDSCQAGQCEPGVNTCQCKTTSDCNKFEDGDQCNGTLYCDKAAGAPYTCKVNPASVVSCPSVNNSACQKNTCVPATGQCKLILSPENTPCDDGDSCTTGDFCDTGLCQGGANTCYCKKDSDCKSFEDGNLCNGSLFCNKATAQCQVNPITVVTCQTVDDTQCLRNTCNPKEGKCYLLPLKDGKVCEDGNPCTPNEACDKGECQSAINTCECQKDADCLSKDDGNLCIGTLYCDVQAKKCRTNPATVVSCNTDDDPACLADVCDPKSGKCKEIGLPKDGTACDDGNPCTALSLCSAGSCVGQANVCECQKDGDCAAKEDGNLCNGTLFCNPKSSKCEVNPATVVACASGFDENCLTNQCDPKTGGCGMQPAHQGNQCDDGSVCSAGGWCALGTCEVTLKQACECVQDSDCAKLEDGDLCNGTLYCDKTGGGNAGGKPSCKLNPSTLITCPTVDNTACSKAMCQAQSGKCAQVAVSGLCEDGKVCTDKDACANGVCLGLAKDCSDGIACTADSCQEPFGCVSLPGPASSCDDQNSCTQDSCDAKVGCKATVLSGSCDDGSACTAQDACKNSACSGTKVDCDDGNPCTADSCDKGKGCLNAPTTEPCSDGNACTKQDACAQGNCSGIKLICDDGNPCSDDSCDPKVGCTAAANTANCDDGNACTTKDVCKGGSCSGGLGACGDGNVCTDDACISGSCAYLNNAAECSDGNACTSGDACSGGKCAGSGKLDCDDKNPCTADSCDAGSGCSHAANAAACDDGSACTVNDACVNGQCAGAKKNCDDANPCTDDSCDPKTGCAAVANTAACSDGNLCSVGDKCSQAKCLAGKDKDCSDANLCTTDTCAPSTGACSSTDTAAKDCDDGNPCTDDACHAVLGCGHVNNNANCDDGNPCTTGDGCSGGNCLTSGVLACDDKNGCTADSCDPKQGCVFAATTKACDDGIGCTSNDVCKDGKCQGKLSCDDQNPCTDDSCNFATGQCVHAAVVGGPCDDGNACSESETCSNGKCAGGTLKACSDGNICTDDGCDTVSGCYSYHNSAGCSTGGCKVDDFCDKGSCKAGPTDRLGEWKIGTPFNIFSHFDARGVYPLKDDWLVYGVASDFPLSQTVQPYFGWLARVTPAGKVVWQQAGGGFAATANVGVFSRVLPAKGGGLLAFGQTGAGWGYVSKLDEDGKSLGGFQFSYGNQTYTHGDTLWRAAQQDFVSVGAGANGAGVVWHHPVTGEKVGSMPYDAKGGLAGFQGCTLAADGESLVAVGWSTEAGGAGDRDGLVAFYGADLSKQPTKRVLLGGTAKDEFRAIERLPDGGFLVAGYKTHAINGRDVFYVRLRADASVVYQKVYNTGANDDAFGVLVQGDASGVIATASGSGYYAGTDAVMFRTDFLGGSVAVTSFGTSGAEEYFHRVITLPGGDLLAAGRGQSSAGKQVALLARTTAYMHTNCSSAGICAAKPMSACASTPIGCKVATCYNSGSGCTQSFVNGAECGDGNACTTLDVCDINAQTCKGSGTLICDDKNPCTFETCDTKAGCVYSPVSDGVSCGNGVTCQSGVCG